MCTVCSVNRALCSISLVKLRLLLNQIESFPIVTLADNFAGAICWRCDNDMWPEVVVGPALLSSQTFASLNLVGGLDTLLLSSETFVSLLRGFTSSYILILLLLRSICPLQNEETCGCGCSLVV